MTDLPSMGIAEVLGLARGRRSKPMVETQIGPMTDLPSMGIAIFWGPAKGRRLKPLIGTQIGPMTDLPSMGVAEVLGLARGRRSMPMIETQNRTHDRPAQHGGCGFLGSREGMQIEAPGWDSNWADDRPA